MRQEYFFCTDLRLCITSCDGSISSLIKTPVSDIIGKKYYEVFPKILYDNKDAISSTLKENKKLFLKKYPFRCLYGYTEADIKINPLLKSKEIKVTIYPYPTCSVANNLQMSQRLIDIGKVATTLAHGVRNPLNAIKGAVVYLRDRYSNEPVFVEFAKIIEEEILHLDSFVSKFLSTSILDEELSKVNLNSLLKNIKVFTYFQTQTRNITTYYEYGHIPLIMINSFQIEQAVFNVINNAIEAMHSGGQLTVKTKLENRGSNFVVIEVINTGTKMDEHRFNDPSAFPQKSNGKGFGLFITREILQYYGGHLKIKIERATETTVVKLFLPTGKIV